VGCASIASALRFLAESVKYHAFFAGFIPVTAWEVGQAYLRAMSTPITGRILKLHKTNC
jgi:hypothetical protein